MQRDIAQFREQLRSGSIQRAYRALLMYMSGLRLRFQREHPEYAVSGLYQGSMDMTYFAVIPASLRERNLKVAIVFNYDAFRFEAWLAAGNRNTQRRYWEQFRNGEWPDYRLVPPAPGVDSILELDLAPGAELNDPEALTARIESGVKAFVDDVEAFLGARE